MSNEQVEFIDKLDFILDVIGANNYREVSLDIKYAPIIETPFEMEKVLYKGRRKYNLTEDDDVELAFGDYEITNLVDFVEKLHPLAVKVSDTQTELFKTLREIK
jgi:hypothetical protein